MPKRNKKLVHQPKDRAQLIKELHANTRFVEKMKFIRTQFYPAVVAASDSVDDAKMFLHSISNVLMEKFLGIMKEKKFSELKLGEALDPKGVHYADHMHLLSLFDNQTVFDAKDVIEGMKNEIDLWVADEMKTRRIETLPVKWIDEI